MEVDPAGRLWVTRSTDGVSPHFVDILTSAGMYQGTLEAPGIPVAFLSETIFVSLRLEESGEMTVSLHELQDTATLEATQVGQGIRRPEPDARLGPR
jgi:hypothetical protein